MTHYNPMLERLQQQIQQGHRGEDGGSRVQAESDYAWRCAIQLRRISYS